MFSPSFLVFCGILLQCVLIESSHAILRRSPEFPLNDNLRLAGSWPTNISISADTVQNILQPNQTNLGLLDREPWPPPSQWPFREQHNAPHGLDGFFAFEFSSPGSVSDADQHNVGEEFLEEISTMDIPLQYPHQFSIGSHDRMRPWVNLRGTLYGSRHLANQHEIYKALLVFFEPTNDGIAVLNGRSCRPMTINVLYSERNPYNHHYSIAKIIFGYRNVPPYPRLGPPHLPQRRPFPIDRNAGSGLEFGLPLDFHEVVYRPRYGRIEAMRLIEEHIHSLAGRNLDAVVDGWDREWEEHTPYDLLDISYSLAHIDFTYGLLLQVLQTWYATISVHGGFSSNVLILVRGQVWGKIKM